jgi:hypothetical protein
MLWDQNYMIASLFKYKLPGVYILFWGCLQTSASMCEIQRDLVHIKRVKCVVSGDVVFSSRTVFYDLYFIIFYCVRLLVAILRI